jgi:hypothetical protein
VATFNDIKVSAKNFLEEKISVTDSLAGLVPDPNAGPDPEQKTVSEKFSEKFFVIANKSMAGLDPDPVTGPDPDQRNGHSICAAIIYLILNHLVLVMEVDGSYSEDARAAAAAAATAAALSSATLARDETTNSGPATTANQVKDSTLPGSLFQQCSNAKRLSRNTELYECTATETGPVFNVTNVTVPRVGSMYIAGNDDIQRNFHGARIMKNGNQTNEVISCTFDPATLNCVSCSSSHSTLDKNQPAIICFSDQNFVPYLNCDPGKNCMAIVRYEDATLADLTSLALEILDKTSLYPGSVLLFGSASHLYRAGASCYAADWVTLTGKIESRFKNINVCPLVPVLREDCPGPLARDIEILAVWLQKNYLCNIKGILESWEAVVHYTHAAATGQTVLPSEEILKLPLPASLSNTQMLPHYFRFKSSNPAILHGMSCTVTTELLRILLTALQKNFSLAVGPEVSLPRAATATEDRKQDKHLVCIGSSIMQQLIPFLQAAGYTITDLSVPGWLATETNIQILITKMSQLEITQEFAVVLDLFSNCSHRYLQFDGTQSLPHKEGGRYHMAGPVAPCNDDTFRRIIKSLAPVLLSAQHARKIVIPPLPRYVFNTCCTAATHCTNFLDDGYAEAALLGITKLRSMVKKECSSLGMRNQWVLDGLGALVGTAPGQSYGTNREILPELRPVLAKDGVHLTQTGNKALATGILSALELLGKGVAEKPEIAATNVTGAVPKRSREYYWRGFTSPIGDTVGRASGSGSCFANSHRGHQRRDRGRPYDRHYRKKF